MGALLNVVTLSGLALILMTGYTMYYGLMEITGRYGLPPPGLTWQVPARWVSHAPKWRRTVVWGSLLGPGFVTRNPYAGFGLLPLAVASMGELRGGIALAMTLGMLHGLGRAFALLRHVRDVASPNYMDSIVKSMRWRTCDGFALLTVAGIAVVALAFNF